MLLCVFFTALSFHLKIDFAVFARQKCFFHLHIFFCFHYVVNINILSIDFPEIQRLKFNLQVFVFVRLPTYPPPSIDSLATMTSDPSERYRRGGGGAPITSDP